MAEEIATVSPSVLKGLITSEGLANCIRMANNGGWHIYPTSFRVSDVIGEIDASRTTLDMFETWYEAPISGRIVQNSETIEFLCTIPPGRSATTKYIREIYLVAETSDGAEFLLGICGIDGTAVYDPAGSIKFRIVVSIENLNLMDLFVFKYTQASEIEDHNNDPNAHPDLSAAITGVGKPTIVYNNYTATEGQTLFVDSSAGAVTIQLPRTGLRAGSKVEVIDVGWKCHEPGREINIVSADHYIDKRKATLVLNQRGASVRLLYWPNQKGWCVDIGGRFYADLDHKVDEEQKTLFYTEYIGATDTISIDKGGVTDSNIGDTIFVDTGNPDDYQEPPTYDPDNPDNTEFPSDPVDKEEFAIKLPAKPASGDKVTIIDSNGNFKNNPVKVDGNGHTVIGSNDLYYCDRAFGLYDFYYDAFTEDWKVTVTSTKGSEAEKLEAALAVMEAKFTVLQGAFENFAKEHSDPWNNFPLFVPVGVVGVKVSGRNPIMPGEDEPRTNWVICDGGADGRGGAVPDLRGRFMLGADASHAANSKGGSETISGTVTGTARGNTGNTSLWAAANGPHAHEYQQSPNLWVPMGNIAIGPVAHWTKAANTGNSGEGAGHSHYVDISLSATASTKGLPPYSSIQFIIRVA